MFQTALKYHVDVNQTGRVEFPVPFAAGAHLTVFVISEQREENVDDSKQTTEALVAELLKQQGCQLYDDKDDFKEALEISSKVSVCQDENAKPPTDHLRTADHLVMTTEKLDSAVEASERILKEAAQGKLPRYV